MDPPSPPRPGGREPLSGLVLGLGAGGEPAVAAPERSVLVLGPPRVGKTSCVVVPNLLAAAGPVVAASTKTDVMAATATARARVGPCLLFDPSGTTTPPPGVERASWSPLATAAGWEGALLVTQSMVLAARPGGERGEGAHWTERAQALLAPALHAAGLEGLEMGALCSLVDRRDGRAITAMLARHDTEIPLEVFEGICRTEEREQSAIWSTASSVLAAYRSAAAREAARGEPVDLDRLCRERGTLYLCASGESQRLAAPIVAGVLRDTRSAAYHAAAAGVLGPASGSAPLSLLLDEVANIAPLHDLPSLVSEGGSQGIVTLACLQDLSQAEERWGALAGGFLSLFNTKLVFPGIGDTRTLEALSLLAGEHEVVTTSYAEGRRQPGLAGLLGRRAPGQTTCSTRPTRRLPVDAIARGWPGHAVCFDGTDPSLVREVPWFAHARWRELAAPAPPALDRTVRGAFLSAVRSR